MAQTGEGEHGSEARASGRRIAAAALALLGGTAAQLKQPALWPSAA